MDRTTPGIRPNAPVIGYQRWDRILFLHWALPPEVLRPHIPRGLDVDTHDGRAYVSLTPFTVRGARLRGTPHLPGLSTFHELNVRTYVHRGGSDPAVWFFSLDAASPLAAAIARMSVRLPYCFARMDRTIAGERMTYECTRLVPPRAATFSGSWRVAGDAAPAQPGSLDEFLVERYFLFSRALGPKLLRMQVHHQRWQLRRVEDVAVQETLTRADGLAGVGGAPLAHYSEGVDVEFFPPSIV